MVLDPAVRAATSGFAREFDVGLRLIAAEVT
jgi:hypothetical protein